MAAELLRPLANGSPARRQRRPSHCGTCGRCSACRRWTEPEDAFVDELLGHCELSEIVRRLHQRYGIERSVPGLVSRLKRRARSRWSADLSLRDLERLFGIDHRVILRWWVKPGLLLGRRWSGRGPHAGWLFSGEAVERFVRDHAYAYNAARMQRGHPLTRLAVVEAALQRWRSCEELAAYLGVSRWTVLRAVRAGVIAHKRRYGAGKHGEVRIRADDFATARERLTADRRPRARRGNRRRLAA